MHPLTDAECLLWRRRAVSIAQHYGVPDRDWDDLAQEGMLGLLRAARRFDPGRGLQFSTFAYHHIVGAVKDAIRRRGGEPVCLSLDEPLSGDDGGTMADFLPAPDADMDGDMEASRLLGLLPPRERTVVEAIVMGDLSAREVAPVLGVSRIRVWQIKSRALERMRGAV